MLSGATITRIKAAKNYAEYRNRDNKKLWKYDPNTLSVERIQKEKTMKTKPMIVSPKLDIKKLDIKISPIEFIKAGAWTALGWVTFVGLDEIFRLVFLAILTK